METKRNSFSLVCLCASKQRERSDQASKPASQPASQQAIINTLTHPFLSLCFAFVDCKSKKALKQKEPCRQMFLHSTLVSLVLTRYEPRNTFCHTHSHTLTYTCTRALTHIHTHTHSLICRFSNFFFLFFFFFFFFFLYFVEESVLTPEEAAEDINPLHYAAAMGDKQSLQEILATASKHDVNMLDIYGRTALIYAVVSDKLTCAEMLIRKGIDLDAPGWYAVPHSPLEPHLPLILLGAALLLTLPLSLYFLLIWDLLLCRWRGPNRFALGMLSQQAKDGQAPCCQ